MRKIRKFDYKPPRVHSGELRTMVRFYTNKPNAGPMPGGKKDEVYASWAKVDEVWLRDLEIAKANGTLSDITVTIRDPQAEFIPTNLHYLSIESPEYADIKFNIKKAQPDMQDKSFINIVAEVSR